MFIVFQSNRIWGLTVVGWVPISSKRKKLWLHYKIVSMLSYVAVWSNFYAINPKPFVSPFWFHMAKAEGRWKNKAEEMGEEEWKKRRRICSLLQKWWWILFCQRPISSNHVTPGADQIGPDTIQVIYRSCLSSSTKWSISPGHQKTDLDLI